jgi:hypothetical protein
MAGPVLPSRRPFVVGTLRDRAGPSAARLRCERLLSRGPVMLVMIKPRPASSRQVGARQSAEMNPQTPQHIGVSVAHPKPRADAQPRWCRQCPWRDDPPKVPSHRRSQSRFLSFHRTYVRSRRESSTVAQRWSNDHGDRTLARSGRTSGRRGGPRGGRGPGRGRGRGGSCRLHRPRQTAIHLTCSAEAGGPAPRSKGSGAGAAGTPRPAPGTTRRRSGGARPGW